MSDASFEPTGRNVTGQKLTLPGRKLTPIIKIIIKTIIIQTYIHTLIKEYYKDNSITAEGEEILRN